MRKNIDRHTCAEINVAGRLLLTVMTVFFQLGLSSDAQARDSGYRSPPLLSDGSRAQPTRAWTEFCAKLPAECMVDPSESFTIDLTPSMLRKLIQINREVNKAILTLPDRQHWGVEDRWDFPTDGVGDC